MANIIAKTLEVPFFTLSAVTSGVKDVREVIEKAKASSFFGNVRGGASPILFIDEIHRFSKSQQDSLLGAVEQGILLNSSSCPMVPLMPASGIHRRMHRKTNSTNA